MPVIDFNNIGSVYAGGRIGRIYQGNVLIKDCTGQLLDYANTMFEERNKKMLIPIIGDLSKEKRYILHKPSQDEILAVFGKDKVYKNTYVWRYVHWSIGKGVKYEFLLGDLKSYNEHFNIGQYYLAIPPEQNARDYKLYEL